MSLPSFTFTGNLKSIGIAVSGALSMQGLTNAQVQFKSNLRTDRLIVFGGGSYTPPDIVYGDVADDGTILANDGTANPVKLLANSNLLSAFGIQWTVTVLIPVPGGTQRISYTFLAGQDGDSIDLGTVIAAGQVSLVPPAYADGDITLIDGGSL